MKKSVTKKTERKPSKIALLEIRVVNLENKVNGLSKNIGLSQLSEDTDTEKKARAEKEKGVIRYGD